MYFSDDALKKLKEGYDAALGAHERCAQQYLLHEFRTERAREFAHQGFVRRINTMVRCIQNVYALLPPERIDIPDVDTRHDAEIQIQTFLFNTFAATDNLAWIWVSEKDVKDAKGNTLRAHAISLRNETVRSSFRAEFQQYLASLDAWFGHLENYRHALAHRIPLYIPPYIVDPKSHAAYEALDRQMAQAARRYDFAERERLAAEQKKLALFRPWMKHSFIEKSHPIVFHPQMVADFNTIDELGRKVVEELDRRR